MLIDKVERQDVAKSSKKNSIWAMDGPYERLSIQTITERAFSDIKSIDNMGELLLCLLALNGLTVYRHCIVKRKSVATGETAPQSLELKP